MRTFHCTLVAPAVLAPTIVQAETTDEWITLGTRARWIWRNHPARNQDRARRHRAIARETARTPCACFADGIAIATFASVGQRTLTIAQDKAPDGLLAVAVIRPRKDGAGLKYSIPVSALPTLGAMNAKFDPRGRYDAVMAAEGLFLVEQVEQDEATGRSHGDGCQPDPARL